VEEAWGVMVKPWWRRGRCRDGGWGTRGESDSPWQTTTSRVIENARDVFWYVVGTREICRCSGKGVNWVKNAK
jgi:hypothetical protein